MKKNYEAPLAEEVSFATEDIAIVLPDDDLSGLSYAMADKV